MNGIGNILFCFIESRVVKFVQTIIPCETDNPTIIKPTIPAERQVIAHKIYTPG